MASFFSSDMLQIEFAQAIFHPVEHATRAPGEQLDYWQTINSQTVEALGQNGRLERLGAVAGGDIHHAYRARLGRTELFIKCNHRSAAAMFEAESDGLKALRENAAVHIPRPICHGADQEHAWLVMEYVPLTRHGDSRALGKGLAAQHRMQGPRFGWVRDNFIGATPQVNTWTRDWPTFWWRHRLKFQVDLALANGHPARLADRAQRLHGQLSGLFRDHAPEPALLHGDLWSGNHGFTDPGKPVLFDPACYYGDRETDLAMTELFGGFDARFYRAYHEAYPLPEGYRRRKVLYQLYHVLNHLNLFGRDWLRRVEAMMDELIHATP